MSGVKGSKTRVKCEGVGGVGWGPQESGNPYSTCGVKGGKTWVKCV